MNIGIRIRERRLEKGLTLEDLAKKIGTSKQTIHRYENGVITNIPSDKIEAIANALDVTPAYLMGWDDEEELTPVQQFQDEIFQKRKLLFDMSANASEDDLNKIITIIDTIIGPND